MVEIPDHLASRVNITKQHIWGGTSLCGSSPELSMNLGQFRAISNGQENIKSIHTGCSAHWVILRVWIRSLNIAGSIGESIGMWDSPHKPPNISPQMGCLNGLYTPTANGVGLCHSIYHSII